VVGDVVLVAEVVVAVADDAVAVYEDCEDPSVAAPTGDDPCVIVFDSSVVVGLLVAAVPVVGDEVVENEVAVVAVEVVAVVVVTLTSSNDSKLLSLMLLPGPT